MDLSNIEVLQMESQEKASDEKQISEPEKETKEDKKPASESGSEKNKQDNEVLYSDRTQTEGADDASRSEVSSSAGDENAANEKALKSAYGFRLTPDEQELGDELWKVWFRLTPDEQELAYELKAAMFRKLQEQNACVSAELELQRSHRSMQLQRQKTAAAYQNQVEMSRANAIKLMRLYEKQAVKGQTRIKQLERENEEANKLAKRYHDMYVEEKRRGGARQKQTPRDAQESSRDTQPDDSNKENEEKENSHTEQNNKGGEKSEKKKSSRVTDADLDDDEAMYTRHVMRVVDTKSMRNTSPIRVADVIRKNEVLLVENEKLRLEIKRLKWDNAQLVKQTKQADAQKNEVLHAVGTSEHARVDLSRRLERERREHQRLQRSLTRQANDWVQIRKHMQEQDQNQRWSTVAQLSPFEAQARTFQHPVKRSSDLPRKMYTPC